MYLGLRLPPSFARWLRFDLGWYSGAPLELVFVVICGLVWLYVGGVEWFALGVNDLLGFARRLCGSREASDSAGLQPAFFAVLVTQGFALG